MPVTDYTDRTIAKIPFSEEMYEANEVRKWAKSEMIAHTKAMVLILEELAVVYGDTYGEVVAEVRDAITYTLRIPGLIDSAFWSRHLLQ